MKACVRGAVRGHGVDIDYVQLDAGVSFGETSCAANMCFGKDTNTGTRGPDHDWYLPKLPFDDPYLSYQPVCRALRTPEL
jgi:hypothetical protein